MEWLLVGFHILHLYSSCYSLFIYSFIYNAYISIISQPCVCTKILLFGAANGGPAEKEIGKTKTSAAHTVQRKANLAQLFKIFYLRLCAFCHFRLILFFKVSQLIMKEQALVIINKKSS